MSTCPVSIWSAAAEATTRQLAPGCTPFAACILAPAEIEDGVGIGTIRNTDPDGHPLTTNSTGVPREHGGEEFTFRLDFSEAPDLSFRTLTGAIQAKRGTVRRARRVTKSSNQSWDIAVEPTGSDRGMIELTLPRTTDCGDELRSA